MIQTLATISINKTTLEPFDSDNRIHIQTILSHINKSNVQSAYVSETADTFDIHISGETTNIPNYFAKLSMLTPFETVTGTIKTVQPSMPDIIKSYAFENGIQLELLSELNKLPASQYMTCIRQYYHDNALINYAKTCPHCHMHLTSDELYNMFTKRLIYKNLMTVNPTIERLIARIKSNQFICPNPECYHIFEQTGDNQYIDITPNHLF